MPRESVSTTSRRDIVVAKMSLTINIVFIFCHSIKWIANIHEIIMVRKLQARLPQDHVKEVNVTF